VVEVLDGVAEYWQGQGKPFWRSSAVRTVGTADAAAAFGLSAAFFRQGVPRSHKIPRSVLVVIYTATCRCSCWNAPAGPASGNRSREASTTKTKPLIETAAREVREETGIDASRYRLTDWGIENSFEIFKQYRSRYADGVTHNQEHVFGLELPAIVPVAARPAARNTCVTHGCRGARLPSAHPLGPIATPSAACRKSAARAQI